MLLAIYTLVVVMLLFGLTIFIHELGHFLVARYYGMKIEAFAIGFGPAIWKKEKDGVLYKIGIIPFGGYVALPQMDPQNEAEAAEKNLPDIAPWKKIPVALAGAVGNIILAFIVAYIIFVIGKPSAPHERDTVVGYVQTESSAYEQGLRPGDRIVSVNSQSVKNWSDIMVSATLAREVTLEAETAVAGRVTMMIPTHDTEMGVRLIPGVSWFGYSDVSQVMSGSSAERAGVEVGDRLVELNGQTLYSQSQLIELVDQFRDQEVPLVVLRKGERVTLTVQPKYDPELDRALIGIGFNPWAVDYDEVVHPRPTELILEFSTLIFRVLGALVTPSTSGMAASALAGPVFILSSLWDMVQNSFAMALWFTCLLNVNLAVLNLMPIPVLDGGHIVFSLWEVITRRRIHHRVKTALMTACWFLLIFAMLYLSFRDVNRLGWLARPAAPIEQVEDGTDE
jgi:regulator of sigma E protease